MVSTTKSQTMSEVALTVSPAFVWTTEATPYGTIHLTNGGTRVAEILISAEIPAEEHPMSGSSQAYNDLSEHLNLFPPRLIIEPGTTGIVRYSIREAATLSGGGYLTMITCHISPRAMVEADQVPTSSAGVQINYAMLVPLILIRGDETPSIVPTLSHYDGDFATLLLQNDGNTPWGGEVRLESEDGVMIYGSQAVTVFSRKEIEIELSAPLGSQVHVVFDGDVSWLPSLVRSRIGTPPPILINL